MDQMHEQIQEGNPHKLTVKQHVLPRASIARFASGGVVQVFKLPYGTVKSLHPKHETFCAMRVWDQRAETIGSARIEAAFQQVADEVADGLRSMESRQNEAISEMFFLWRARFEAMGESRDDLMINGIAGENLSHDRRERFEKAGAMYLLPGGKFPKRFVNSITLRRKVDFDLLSSRPIQWGVIEAAEGEFIVPDTVRNWLLMPITPKIFLGGNSPNLLLGFEAVAENNSLLRSLALRYYFAKDLNACPIRKRTLPWLRIQVN